MFATATETADSSRAACTRRGTRRGGQRGEARLRQREKRNAYPRINREIIAVAGKGSLAELLELVQPLVPEMNLVNLSTAMHRIAKLATAPEARVMLQRHPVMPELSAAVSAALRQRMQSWDAPANSQALSNITWALAMIEYVDVDVIAVAAAMSAEQIAEFKPFELSGLLWALAKLGQLEEAVLAYSMPVFREAAGLIPENSEQFHYRCLVMTVWSFATVKEFDASLFYGLAPRLSPAVKQASCQELVQIMWAYSRAGIRQERLFEQVAAEALQRAAEFKASELGSLFSSFADLGLLESYFFSESFISNTTTDPVLLHLLESLFMVKENGNTRGAICQLFQEAGRRAPWMAPVDFEALVEICARMGYPLGRDSDVGAVARCCQLLATARCADDDDVAEADVHMWQSQASVLSCSDGFNDDDLTSPDEGHWIGSRVSTQATLPPMPAVVLDHRAKSADAKATGELLSCVQALHSDSEEEVLQQQQKPGGAKVETILGTVSFGRAMHLTCTVKNTFLDVTEEDGSTGDEDGEVYQVELPEPLSIIPAEVSPEQLQAFRVEYQKFRLGRALGAKGELAGRC